MESIDLQAFLDRVNEDGYVVLWDFHLQQWRKYAAIDGKTGYLAGLLLLHDPDGSTPDRDLTMTHAERLRIERSGQRVTTPRARPGTRIHRGHNRVLRNG